MNVIVHYLSNLSIYQLMSNERTRGTIMYMNKYININ